MELTRSGVRQALLELDYSQGALRNKHAANKLAERLCLTDEQRNAKDSGGRHILYQMVNGVIVALVKEGKLVRTRYGRIMATTALKNIVVNFLAKLSYEPVEVEVVENSDNNSFSVFIDIGTQHLKFSVEISE